MARLKQAGLKRAGLHPSAVQALFARQHKSLRLVLPVMVGCFAALGHDPWVSGFYTIVIAVVLVLLTLPLTTRAAAWHGWLFGLGYFAITLRWIVEPFLVDPVRHGWMAPFAMILMAGGAGLFWAVAFGAARWIAGAGAVVMLWLPVTLALAELARGHVFTGFPWGLMSYTLIGGLGDVWFAWVGPYGTNFLLLAVAGGLAYGLHRGWMLVWPALVGVVLATTGLATLTARAPAPTGQVVRLVQPNALQHLKWDPAWMPVFFDRAIEQTRAGDVPDAVIWPETSVPALLDYAGAWTEQMAIAARGAPVVAGIQRREAGEYYNSAILIEGPDWIEDVTDKAHLVPFGEYIPLADWLEPLGFGTLVDQVAGFSAGRGDGLMQISGLGLARVLICYEGIFPEEIQRGETRADILLIITNDAWFGGNAGPQQHLAQARARAIEQGLPVVRAANTGISAVIDARGRIVASLDMHEAAYLDAPVPAALPPPLYARIGDWPLAVLLVLAAVTGAWARRPNKIDALQARR